jgi:protein TonB
MTQAPKTQVLLVLAAAALAACTPPNKSPVAAAPDTSPPAPPEVPSTVPGPVVSAPAPSIAPRKPTGPLDEYKQRNALRILQANSHQVYEGAPPHFLKSVVVLIFVVDARGQLASSRVLRGNGHKQLEEVALASVKRAAPFDPPPKQLLRGNTIEITETWLFRDDGKFQVRSVALPQPGVSSDETDTPPRAKNG